MKNFRYFFEAAALYLLLTVFSLMPVRASSALGGWLGKTIGPRLAASRKANRNLRLALPDKNEAEYAKVIKGMWENLGRTIGEYPHLKTIVQTRLAVSGDKLVRKAQKDGKPVILIGGHLANWEVGGQYVAGSIGPIASIYREPNNPWSATLLRKMRSNYPGLQLIPKSKVSTRAILRALREKKHVGLLIDQKYNPGIAVPFFGRPAMTSTAFVQLAQKMNISLIPVRIERLRGAQFQLTFMEPVQTFNQDSTPRDVDHVIQDTHQILETWIKDKPEQWIWLHRRWSDS